MNNKVYDKITNIIIEKLEQGVVPVAKAVERVRRAN